MTLYYYSYYFYVHDQGERDIPFLQLPVAFPGRYNCVVPHSDIDSASESTNTNQRSSVILDGRKEIRSEEGFIGTTSREREP